uniref:Uncharacterized protein n=1 Tax=Anguilla anguilla TaxID=7936 RepID=A0A0E9TFR5_ANGAN
MGYAKTEITESYYVYINKIRLARGT